MVFPSAYSSKRFEVEPLKGGIPFDLPKIDMSTTLSFWFEGEMGNDWSWYGISVVILIKIEAKD